MSEPRKFGLISWQKTRAIRNALLRWYESSKRDLPWRRRITPYRILVSEFMLQQTRVETVLEYYGKFLRRFPSLRALARAREDDVLAVWSGLGYYRRARNLHRAAIKISEHYSGRVPREVDTLRELPGVGRYTAGAVASIAFDLPQPAVDGNVCRVFSRMFVLEADVLSRAWDLAALLVPAKGGAGDFNQALMDLGARVCLPRKPDCPICPVRRFCEAFKSDRIAEFPPVASPRPRVARVFVARAVIVCKDRYLIYRNPDAKPPGGMYEFPSVEMSAHMKPGRALVSEIARYGVKAKMDQELGWFRHRILDREYRVTAYGGRVSDVGRGLPSLKKGRWASRRQLDRLPLSAASLQILRLLYRKPSTSPKRS